MLSFDMIPVSGWFEIAAVAALLLSLIGVRVRMRRTQTNDGPTFQNELHLESASTQCVGTTRAATRLPETAFHGEAGEALDRLTTILNRNTFHDQLASMLRRDDGQYTLLAKIDIRRFHDINTSFGYAAGDALLREIGQRLRKLPDAAVGRMSGDEFAVAFPLSGPDAAKGVISAIQALLDVKFVLPDAPFKPRFSIGFAVGQPEDEYTALLRRVGVALHEAKASPFVDVREFDRNAAIRSENRARLTRDLQQAIEHAELLLYYQPKVDLATGEIVGAEALLRWDDPFFGILEPNSFIPVAEESGLIVDIGAWSLRRAAAFVVRLNRGRSRPLVVSVNVSQLQFEYSDLAQLLRTIVEETGADPSWLMLELTERVVTDNSAVMIRRLRQLRDMGFGLSIDDFGTGYSSLSYLEAFPFSEFKIDRTFVSKLDQSRSRQVIVEAMIRLGRELQISVTAEGAETEEELAVLRRLDCPFVQGYIFGRPMTQDDFINLVDGAAVSDGLSSGADARHAILIDDDASVRDVVGGALGVLGWAVTSTASAEQALAMSDVFPTPKLIVTDVNLGPGMTGFELLPHARRRWPAAGIVVISGRPVDASVMAGLGGRETFLSKPATIDGLASAISQVVENSDRHEPERIVPEGFGAASVRRPSWGDLATLRGPEDVQAGAGLVDRAVAVESAARWVPGEVVAESNRDALAGTMGVDLEDEVHAVLEQISGQATARKMRFLVAIESDIVVRVDPIAFRGLLSRIIAGAIIDSGYSGGRVLIAAMPEGDRIQITVTYEAVAADPVLREITLRHAEELTELPDALLRVKFVPGGGIKVSLTLPGS
jgi:diguanylate cyclase (GGDEF)-like protein